MADEFDPYYTWLGISAKDQPANHYRLLGIEVFEANPNVIEHAADRQMGHLRTFQTGARAKLCQKLLNEVAAAKILLLNVQKKAPYDEGLRRGLSAPVADVLPVVSATVLSGIPSQSTEPSDAELFSSLIGGMPTRSAPKTAASAPQNRVALRLKRPVWIAGLSAAALLLLLGVWLLMRSSGQPEPILAGGAQPIAPSTPPNATPLPTPTPRPTPTPLPNPAPPVDSRPNANTPPARSAVLVFDWPDANRSKMTVSVDGAEVPAPKSGPWEYRCAAGEHRVHAERPGYHELETVVNLDAGERRIVSEVLRPKSTLALNWKLEDRAGTEFLFDGQPLEPSADNPWQMAIEPGRHTIHVTRGSAVMYDTAFVALPDQRTSLDVTNIPPGLGLMMVYWPPADREGATLTVNGHVANYGDTGVTLRFVLPPGSYTMRFEKPGFKVKENTVQVHEGWPPLQFFAGRWAPETTIADGGSPVDKGADSKSPGSDHPDPEAQPALVEGNTRYVFKTGPWVDVLSRVKLEQHRYVGNWSRDGNDISCDAGPHSRLVLPVNLSGAYEIALEFTRVSGNSVAVIFPFDKSKSSCDVTLGTAASGLELLDGHPFDDPHSRLGKRPGGIENGRRYDLRIFVRNQDSMGHINVLLDGANYLRPWAGEAESLEALRAVVAYRSRRDGAGRRPGASDFPLRPRERTAKPRSPDAGRREIGARAFAPVRKDTLQPDAGCRLTVALETEVRTPMRGQEPVEVRPHPLKILLVVEQTSGKSECNTERSSS